MNKFLPVFLVVFLAVNIYFIRQTYIIPEDYNHSQNSVSIQTGQLIQKPKKAYAADLNMQYSPPAKVYIPVINLSADIIPVGIDYLDRMDVPDNFIEVGWYSLGYKAGEKGSVVLDGHHDDFRGNPAVFYNLSNLKTGDEILIDDQKGNRFTYKVIDNKFYRYDLLPMHEIFASNDKARLNLITCAGSWDSNRHDYSHRTVIYAELDG